MIEAVIILFFLIFQNVVDAQSCLILDETNACGKDFIGFPIDLPAINSVQQFNNELASSTNANAYAEFGCKAEEISQSAIPFLRYYSSFWCSAWVAEAAQKNCTSNKSNSSAWPVLCRDQCSLAISSFNLLVKSCSDISDKMVQNRKKMIDYFTTTCQEFASKQTDSKSCTQGTEIESKFCGKIF